MSDAENILNENKFFVDTVHTLSMGIEQHKKRGCLKGEMSKGIEY